MDNPELPEPKQRRLRWIAVISIVLLTVAAAGTYTWFALGRSCDAEAIEEASVILLRQRDRFDHSYQFATSASQDSIVRPVAELQQLLMDTQDVVVPACMETAKKELIEYMGTVIRAFLAYGARETNITVRQLIDESETHYDNFRTELEAVNRCAPFCIP